MSEIGGNSSIFLLFFSDVHINIIIPKLTWRCNGTTNRSILRSLHRVLLSSTSQELWKSSNWFNLLIWIINDLFPVCAPWFSQQGLSWNLLCKYSIMMSSAMDNVVRAFYFAIMSTYLDSMASGLVSCGRFLRLST